MNEFLIINKYLKSLSLNNSASLNLSDDIYFDKTKNMAVSMDTYVEDVHFFNSTDPKFFLKKILRSSLSDLYCKGVKPQTYFLSFALNKKYSNHLWLSKVNKILKSEQKKFDISLGGGDTTYSSKLVITITVIGFSKKKIVLRKGSSVNDDIYITGNVGDSFLGLCLIKKKMNFGIHNNFFKKNYYEPNLPTKIFPYLGKIASASIDVSDGLAQDLSHICKLSKCGATVDLSKIPLSFAAQKIVFMKKIHLKDMFSKGDDYQILFTSKIKYRNKISSLSKKLNLRISRIGSTNNDLNINFKYKGKKLKLSATKMGYTHTF